MNQTGYMGSFAKNSFRFLRIIFFLLVVGGTSQAETSSPHGSNFKIPCQQCHTEKGWQVDVQKISFDHSETGYALMGGHARVECQACHSSLKFNEVGIQCADCHNDVHRNELGIACENCHTPNSWDNRTQSLNIHSATDFPLIGAHANVDCQACHRTEQGREFSGLSTECSSCHLNSYLENSGINHELAGFNRDCASCHFNATHSWKQTHYTHISSFPLAGGHRNIPCADCHQDRYKGTPNACVSCHQSDFNRTTDPPHAVFQFPTVCERCHTTTVWSSAVFDHFEESGFRLEGIHATAQVGCMSCHVNNQLTGLPKDCYGCHQSDFEQVTNPDHVAGHFPFTCLDCHNQNSFTPADFNHDATNFPLTGAHRSLDCSQCHGNGYANTPLECVACHQKEYDNTSDPAHAAAQFPTTCADCHSTSAWTPAQFDHDGLYFPIYSGKHRDEWNQCADCHTNAADYKVFECINCHEHERTKMDDKHREVQNYSYNSAACYDCHPQGKADD